MGGERQRPHEAARIDEADLAIAQRRMEPLLELADKIDAEKAAIAKGLEADVTQAASLMKRGEHLSAAIMFEKIAAEWAARGFRGESSSWERRAADARAVARLKKRNAKKGPKR